MLKEHVFACRSLAQGAARLVQEGMARFLFIPPPARPLAGLTRWCPLLSFSSSPSERMFPEGSSTSEGSLFSTWPAKSIPLGRSDYFPPLSELISLISGRKSAMTMKPIMKPRKITSIG